MSNHAISPATHTVEVSQLRELNHGLGRGAPGPPLTAELLGVAAARADVEHLDRVPWFPAGAASRPDRRLAAGTVPAGAVLKAVVAAGPPSFPYIYGLFGAEGSDALMPVQLHTAHLRRVSAQLHLRHHWGVEGGQGARGRAG